MTLHDLFKTIEKNELKVDQTMIQLAYDYAKEAHEGQKRESGEDYIQHSLATAINLANMKVSTPVIIAGLLHDVPEDTKRTIKDIKNNFGGEVAALVEGITKLGKIKYRGVERYIENLRKMFLSMAQDLRVILIKFADRMHNLETLKALPERKQKRIAMEVLEIYAPIANRLGMGEIKGRLEDLAFPFVYPKEYEWVKAIAESQCKEKEKLLKEAKTQIDKELKKEGIKVVSIHGRTKHLYSFYKKLLKYNRDITKIYDLVALRIIVKNVADCYATLGVIHKRWIPLKGRIKDYIARPKPNGYQSLHTTVFCDSGEIIEFQIRTEKMHEEAEYGIAAHWHYDEKGSIIINKNLQWVEEFARWHKEMRDEEYLDSLKIDVFQDRIFVFTPQGDVIDLPENSTPVDFAYHVHTEIGDKCSGAKINDQLVSLDTKLNSGDVVEIILDKNRKGPSADWLKFVKTKMAKNKIRANSKSKLKSLLTFKFFGSKK